MFFRWNWAVYLCIQLIGFTKICMSLKHLSVKKLEMLATIKGIFEKKQCILVDSRLVNYFTAFELD